MIDNFIKLPFELKNFYKITWISDLIKNRWEKKLKDIREFIPTIHCQQVSSNIVSSIILAVYPYQVFQYMTSAKKFGSIKTLILGDNFQSEFSPLFSHMNNLDQRIFIAISSEDNLAQIQSAWQSNSLTLLPGSWPRCCLEWHRKQTDSHLPEILRLALNSKYSLLGNIFYIEDKNDLLCNYLFNYLDVWLLAHMPCAFDCVASNLQLIRTLEIINDASISSDLKNLLNWPVEFSMLHGIGEIKFPLCKIATNVIATAYKHTIQVAGKHYPENVPNGVLFPYRLPTHLRLSQSKGYQAGLEWDA